MQKLIQPNYIWRSFGNTPITEVVKFKQSKRLDEGHANISISLTPGSWLIHSNIFIHNNSDSNLIKGSTALVLYTNDKIISKKQNVDILSEEQFIIEEKHDVLKGFKTGYYENSFIITCNIREASSLGIVKIVVDWLEKESTDYSPYETIKIEHASIGAFKVDNNFMNILYNKNKELGLIDIETANNQIRKLNIPDYLVVEPKNQQLTYKDVG